MLAAASQQQMLERVYLCPEHRKPQAPQLEVPALTFEGLPYCVSLKLNGLNQPLLGPHTSQATANGGGLVHPETASPRAREPCGSPREPAQWVVGVYIFSAGLSVPEGEPAQ